MRSRTCAATLGVALVALLIVAAPAAAGEVVPFAVEFRGGDPVIR